MARTLHAVPASAPRAICYLRQSTSREESISLELQETACRDYCARMGYTVVRTESDPGISGRTWKRPAVQRTIAAIEAGEADVVVLWKWSRLSRSRRDWAVAVDTIETVGGRLESATEPVDATTSSGRLARGMLAEFAAFESERIGDTWKEAHGRRVRNGLPANGKPRWGYKYQSGQFSPDPTTGPVLAALYHRYLAGESVYGLTKWLNDAGYRTSPGYSRGGTQMWTQTTLRRVLDKGFGAGMITVGGELRKGAHEPVITAEEWTRYLAARNARRTVRGTERSQYLLSGLVRCSCGSPMGGGQFGHARSPKFRCIASFTERRHAGGYIMMQVVEAEVLTWLRDLATDIDVSSSTAQLAIAHARIRKQDATASAREIVAIDKELLKLTDGWMRNVIPESAYLTLRAEAEQRRAQHAGRLELAEADALSGPNPQQQATDLLRDWDELNVALRRGALRSLIARIEVTTGRPKGTVAIVPRWSEPRT